MLEFPADGLDTLKVCAISLAIGLLIGLERERTPSAKAGLRTFGLTALFGALLAILAVKMESTWILAAGLLAVASMIIAAYIGPHAGASADNDARGTTTQVALLLTFVYGVLVGQGEGPTVIMLAIVTTMLLYFKPELHGLSKSMERRDMLSILQFGVLSFIILPILPDQDYGPHGVLNPQHIWLMVVLLSGISLAGYMALRLVGERYGAPLIGIMGGLASSTATTLIYARQGKTRNLMKLAVRIILLANLVVFVRIAIITGSVAPRLFVDLLPVLLGGLLMGAAATLFIWRSLEVKTQAALPDIVNPTEIRVPLLIGLGYAVVLLLSAVISDWAGSTGLYAMAVAAGFSSLDAVTLTSFRLHGLNEIDAGQVVNLITLALLTNILFKLCVASFIGGRQLALACLPGMAAILVGVVGGWMVSVWVL